jgi:phosphoribosyl-ATP pyrophosphohydrolase/phosphoribosyl-AMP cyclohydrolase/histidinol dehydrogenase
MVTKEILLHLWTFGFLLFSLATVWTTGFSIHPNHHWIKKMNGNTHDNNDGCKNSAMQKNGGFAALTRVSPENVGFEIHAPVDPDAYQAAQSIRNEIKVSDKQENTVDAAKLLQVCQRLGDVDASETSLIVSKEECERAFANLSERERTALSNIHERIRTFAEAQRRSIADMEISIPGGHAGHTVSPVSAAGCYAPGGRYPLPSSVLMTVVTAKAAGVETVMLASPKPSAVTLAAAHLAGADIVLKMGGAQAIFTMAYGCNNNDNDMIIPRCDVICGPGNKWVTAAKSIVNGYCGIDMLAGPSEVLVIADETANPETIAADLIAQAEHDVVARAILICTDQNLMDAVDQQISLQLNSLPEPNQSTAKAALGNSFAVLCESIEQAVKISDDIAPEHLEIQTKDAPLVGKSCRNYGGLFVGEHAAEVLGDYGAGPNHTLPTGGTGRYTGGLSVLHFLRVRTWMRIDQLDEAQCIVDDAIVLARLEGLEGHARAAETRSLTVTPAFKKPKTDTDKNGE